MQRGCRSVGDSPFIDSGSSRAWDGSTKETMSVSSRDESAFSSDRVVTAGFGNMEAPDLINGVESLPVGLAHHNGL